MFKNSRSIRLEVSMNRDFYDIKKEVSEWQRPRPRKPFRQQKGGLRCSTIAMAHKFLRWISGGDPDALVDHLHRYPLEQLHVDEPPRINPNPRLPEGEVALIQDFYRSKCVPAATPSA